STYTQTKYPIVLA
nr:extracellular lipase [Pseudomonas aeruginosa, strain TE3285, Peptide Partial, 13 aa] [Pseudomonas aeruginosa]